MLPHLEIPTPASLPPWGCSGHWGLSPRGTGLPWAPEGFPGAFALELLPQGARTFLGAEAPASLFPALPTGSWRKGSVPVHSPLAHILQPFGEQESSSVRIQIPEKAPRLTQLGSEVHSGTISYSQGPPLQVGSGQGWRGHHEPGGHHECHSWSFTPRKRACVTMPRCATKSLPTLEPGTQAGVQSP